MTITIKTALAEGIYASAGGGQITTYYEWATGPRNLLKAVKVLGQHSAEMTQGFGNVGHCGSWIEVDGVRVKDCDLTELDPGWVREARRECPDMRIKSATESADWLIENIKARAANERAIYATDEEIARVYDQWDQQPAQQRAFTFLLEWDDGQVTIGSRSHQEFIDRGEAQVLPQADIDRALAAVGRVWWR